ncbi:hypothetical protein NQZ68_031487 [Dissostichus eleginoides]|nr:hypothetical protein NQZ68_031487 [Dissostichus eleginoides]
MEVRKNDLASWGQTKWMTQNKGVLWFAFHKMATVLMGKEASSEDVNCGPLSVTTNTGFPFWLNTDLMKYHSVSHDDHFQCLKQVQAQQY